MRPDASYFARLFDEMAGETDDLMKRILRTSSNYMVRETRKRFTRQLDPDNKPWKPLKPLTVQGRKNARKKGRGGRGNRALVNTGELRREVVPEFTSNEEVKISAVAPHALYQHEGIATRITGKQAWWMVCNLFGYDPEHPEKFGREAFGKGEKGIKGKALKPLMGSYGRMMAGAMWKSLVGRILRVPPRRFMGINRENANDIEELSAKHLTAFINRRSGGNPILAR